MDEEACNQDSRLAYFMDESAADERTGNRKYDWALMGITLHEYLPFKRSERWSILRTYTVNGLSLVRSSWDPSMRNHSKNSSKIWFCHFVAHFLVHAPCSSWIMLQFTILRFVLILYIIINPQRLQELYDEAGVKLEFFPPYSPDFNPIEGLDQEE